MSPGLIFGLLVLTAIASTVFATLSLALREVPRSRLQAAMAARGKAALIEPLTQRSADLIFLTAGGRLTCNILILICFLRLLHPAMLNQTLQDLVAILATMAVTVVCAVALPNALARHGGAAFIAVFAKPLLMAQTALSPLTQIAHAADNLVGHAAGTDEDDVNEHAEQNMLSAVEEGEKEGVVDDRERRMIESVIRFGDTTVNQIMTARPEMILLDISDSLEAFKQRLEQTGHSRIPVQEGSVDKIVGVLYARDLLKFVGRPADEVDIRSAVRPAFFVPETRNLTDLFDEFRVRKVHMAIVQDEYGGTAGLVTIEDVLEELVGDISDEHEPTAPALLKSVGEHAWEAEARIYLDEFNRLTGLALPEDSGFDTLGGYVSNALGHIPKIGETLKTPMAVFTTIDAEPQKVNRVRVELIPATPAS